MPRSHRIEEKSFPQSTGVGRAAARKGIQLIRVIKIDFFGLFKGTHAITAAGDGSDYPAVFEISQISLESALIADLEQLLQALQIRGKRNTAGNRPAIRDFSRQVLRKSRFRMRTKYRDNCGISSIWPAL